MFTIIGGDGKEYGPVTTEQVRNWIASGRANLETSAKATGSNEWRRLGDYAEFAIKAEPPPTVIGTGISGGPQSGQPALAGRGARFVAALIDGGIEMACWTPTLSAAGQIMREQIETGDPSIPLIMSALHGAIGKSLPYLAALVIAQCALLSLRGQSIGKLLLRVQIVRYRTNETAGFLHAFFLRGTIPWLITLVPLFGRLFWLIDVCFIFGDERRCVHDYIGGTKVVKR